MVATVLRLRWRSLGNSLARSPWQLVGFCLGMLGAFWLLVAVIAGVVALGALQGLDVVRTIAVLAGSALVLGWVLGPLLVAGTEATVDAPRLAPFPITTRQIMRALTATGLTGIPGLFTALASLSTALLWVAWPAAALAAVPAVAVAVLTCVVASRLITTLSAGLGGHRRGREVIGTVVLGLVVMTGPILMGLLSLVDAASDTPSRFATAATILGWTPLGAAWAVPGDVAAGAVVAALAKLAIAVATLAVLWVVWERALGASLASPPRRVARVAKPGALGFFGVMPTGGVGATWSRSLTGWLRDPRYLRQLVLVPLFPVLFAIVGGVHGWLFTSSSVLVALVLALAGYADISYDGTAFAAVLASGVRGRADRWGRMLGAASVGVPAVLVIAFATAAIGGAWHLLPALLGGAFGLLLVGYGVSAVSSALIVVPVAAAGDSPFKTVPGQTSINGFLVLLVMGACALLAAPSVGLAIVAAARSSVGLGWIALLVAVVIGAVVIVVGVMVGGRTFDRTAPDLLARIKAFPA